MAIEVLGATVLGVAILIVVNNQMKDRREKKHRQEMKKMEYTERTLSEDES